MGVMILLPLVMAADIFLWLFVVGMFVPQQASPIVAQLFDVYRQNIIPERDVLYFHAYMLLAAGLFTLLCFQQSRLKTHAKAFKRFLYYEIIITLLSGFMLAKFLLWREAFWLNGFYACVGVSIVSKLCWPELLKLWQRVSEFIDSNQSIPARIGWAAGIIFCIAVIWVRDPLGAAAKIFLGEQFHHMDWFLVPAAWAHLMGNILDIDTISRYGLGAPVWVAHLANILPGHFSYANVIAVLASISVVYFCIWFYNIRSLMGSIGWALLILVWGVRLQMFHTETLPFALTYPQVTPLRCFFDAIVFGLLISFMRRPVAWKLWLASICCGIAIYNIIGEGLYLTGAFGFFILLTQAMAYLQKSKPLGDLSVGKVLLLLVMPLVTFVAIAYAFAGQHVFGREFWSNQIEFIRFYQAGHGSLPLMMNLTQGNFYISIWPFVLPIFYMASLLLVAYRIVQKKSQPMDMIIAALSVYLLLAFHYQATVSNNTTAYLRNAIVMMTISGYWLNDYWRHIALTHVRRWQLAIGMAGIFALATNHMFLIYPNLLNLAKNPMSHPIISHNPPGRFSYFNHLFVSYPDNFKMAVNNLGTQEELLVTERNFANDDQVKEFYRQQTDYTKDAQLIQSLTKKGEQVPLIASFEPIILMQAKRAPFFYTFDILNSRPRQMRHWAVSLLYTQDNLKRELDRLDVKKPEYVFMEKIFLQKQIPPSYPRDMQDTIALLTEVFKRYEPYRDGEYLVALRRKQ